MALRLHVLEEGDVRLVGRCGRVARLGKPRGKVGILHLGRQQLADVPSPGTSLVGGALQEDGRNHVRPQVARAVLEVAGNQPQPRDRRVDQLRHRPKPVQKQREDAGEAGVEVGVGLAAPHLEVVDDPPAVEDADHQVAIDPVVEGQVGGFHLAEASEP